MNSEHLPTGFEQERSLAPDSVKNWFGLSVMVRHEKVVAEILGHKGFETFLPLYTKTHRYHGRLREFDLPLFSGYVFCHLNPLTRLPVLTTPGVIRIVGAGRNPIPIDPHEIWSLQRAAEAGVSLCPHQHWEPGESARVIAGPLTGVEGVVVKAKDAIRLVLSVSLLQRSVSLEIDSECVASVAKPPAAVLGRGERHFNLNSPVI